MENQASSKKFPITQLVIGLLLIGALTFGALVAAPVIVQAQEETPTPPENASEWPEMPGRRGFRPGGIMGPARGAEFDTYLADALGITVEELQAAYQTAHKAALQAAVEDGRITAEQADLILARNALRQYIDREALMAQALGISVADLQAAREEGKPVRDLIDELGLSLEDVRDALKTAYEAAVAQAVQDGVITQAQADLILSKEAGPGLFDRGMFGGERFDGGLRGPRGVPPAAPETNSTPDSQS